MTTIVPAVIPQSIEHLESSLTYLEGVPEVHIDVVDGVFVPFVSWPYSPKGAPSESVGYLRNFSVEVDIMASEPLPMLMEWVAAGTDMVVLHAETVSVESFKRAAEIYRCSIGISALNDTPYETLAEYLPYADYVQVMGIAKIGAQGQPFDERSLTRRARIRSEFPQLPISIDGSVNRATLPQLVQHDFDRYIVGSAIMAQTHPTQAYSELKSLLHIPRS